MIKDWDSKQINTALRKAMQTWEEVCAVSPIASLYNCVSKKTEEVERETNRRTEKLNQVKERNRDRETEEINQLQERNTHRETHRQRQRQPARQRQGQRERQTDRQTDRQRHRHRERERETNCINFKNANNTIKSRCAKISLCVTKQ